MSSIEEGSLLSVLVKGRIAGFVGITPVAGYMQPWLGTVIGFLTAVICALLQDTNESLGIDEGLYIFKLRGIGCICGNFFTDLFATTKNFQQPAHYVPGLYLRVSEEGEIRGLDLDQFFDEQIGDWSFFDEMKVHGVLQGRPKRANCQADGRARGRNI
ncbi:MAG: hypothetical protein M1820_001001 [Bogoriella megaspora]|nr:MAG: hypothetical protein M1820_001001 [Bogoriella megaspora]